MIIHGYKHHLKLKHWFLLIYTEFQKRHCISVSATISSTSQCLVTQSQYHFIHSIKCILHISPSFLTFPFVLFSKLIFVPPVHLQFFVDWFISLFRFHFSSRICRLAEMLAFLLFEPTCPSHSYSLTCFLLSTPCTSRIYFTYWKYCILRSWRKKKKENTVFSC